MELLEIPPNGQGLAAQIALGILAHLPVLEMDSVALIHQQIEAMKIAVHAANEHFADEMPCFCRQSNCWSRVRWLAARGIGFQAASLPPVSLPVGEDTVYLTTADEQGMMVSFIQSNFRAFRFRYRDSWHRHLDAKPRFGVLAGFCSSKLCGAWQAAVSYDYPRFRHPRRQTGFSFGVMGGHMQHQGHVQMVSRIFDYGQNPQEASDAPRWHVYPDLTVGLEAGMPQVCI